MPTLPDPRHEAFAQSRARGMLLIDAYENAGFVRHRGHPSRLACKPEVAERIAELRRLEAHIEDTSLPGLLASLRLIIMAGESSENPTLVNAARLAIVDAARLHDELSRRQALNGAKIDSFFNSLAEESAHAAAPEPAAQRPSPPKGAPVSAPSAPRRLPESAPRAPHRLLASAAASPLGLPDLSALPRGAAVRRPPSPPPPLRPPAAH